MSTATRLKATLANGAHYLEKKNQYIAELDETLMMLIYAWNSGVVKELYKIAECQMNLIEAYNNLIGKLKSEVEKLYKKLSVEKGDVVNGGTTSINDRKFCEAGKFRGNQEEI